MQSLEVARYPSLKEGYESFYLVAREPGGARAVWIRYTVHKSAVGQVAGSVWCSLFDRKDARATKVTRPHPDHEGVWLRVGEAVISPGVARADLPGATWDIGFRGEPEFRHLPWDQLYAAALPKTKPVSLHPSATFDGTLTLGTETVDLGGWQGMVGHNWGTQHAERWIWLHGLFDDGWLDLVIARIKVAGLVMPWVAMGGLMIGGVLTRVGRGMPGRGLVIRERADGCHFELPGGVRGDVSARPTRFVGWQYADPDGSSHDVVNCSIADLTLSANGRTLKGHAVYELGMREHDHGVPIQPFGDG